MYTDLRIISPYNIFQQSRYLCFSNTFRMRTSDANQRFGQTGCKRFAIQFDSFERFTHALTRFCSGYFEIVMGCLMTKTRALDELDIKLKFIVGNKIVRCLPLAL